jgi:hypothetical protein
VQKAGRAFRFAPAAGRKSFPRKIVAADVFRKIPTSRIPRDESTLGPATSLGRGIRARVEIREDIVSIRACGCLVHKLIVTRGERRESTRRERASGDRVLARQRARDALRSSALVSGKGNEITSYTPLARGNLLACFFLFFFFFPTMRVTFRNYIKCEVIKKADTVVQEQTFSPTGKQRSPPG